jgi:hypothetical protein
VTVAAIWNQHAKNRNSPRRFGAGCFVLSISSFVAFTGRRVTVGQSIK